MNPVTVAANRDRNLTTSKQEKKMKLNEFLVVLADNPSAAIHLMLPDGAFVPAHFHVTEVGRVHKDFIDCGGTVRSLTSCVLQVWVAEDTQHRLETAKLAKILTLAAPLFGTNDLPVEVEYEDSLVSQYPLVAVEVTPAGLLLHLGSKHTACLAAERCDVIPTGVNCCSTSSCC
jgi:Family of unknown function (DUF6428)